MARVSLRILDCANGMFRESRMKHIVACVIMAFFLVVMSILPGIFAITRDYAGASGGQYFPGRIVTFDLNVISMDAKAGRIVLSWFIVSDTGCPRQSANCSTSAVNIFFDENLETTPGSTTKGIQTNGVPTEPTFIWSPDLINDFRSNTASFRTPVNFLKTSSLQVYPFDKYYTELTLFAQDAVTNETVGVDVTRTSGIAVGFSISGKPHYDPLIPNTQGVYYHDILLTRGLLVKAYAVVMVLVVWLITLLFVFACLMHFVFGYPMQAEFLVIPIATLFTITQLRDTLPGTPDFGTVLDYIGLFPCVALTSFCATVSVGSLAFSRHDVPTRFALQCNPSEAEHGEIHALMRQNTLVTRASDRDGERANESRAEDDLS